MIASPASPVLTWSGLELVTLARLLGDRSYSSRVRGELLMAYLVVVPAAEVPGRLDDLAVILHAQRMRYLVQHAVRLMQVEEPEVAQQIALGLTPREVFGEAETSTCVELANSLAEVRPDLLELLDQGALGEWGGDAFAVDLAFLYRGTDRNANPEQQMAFLRSVFTSPHLDARTAQLMGTTLFIHLDSLGKRVPSLVPEGRGPAAGSPRAS